MKVFRFLAFAAIASLGATSCSKEEAAPVQPGASASVQDTIREPRVVSSFSASSFKSKTVSVSFTLKSAQTVEISITTANGDFLTKRTLSNTRGGTANFTVSKGGTSYAYLTRVNKTGAGADAFQEVNIVK